MFSFFKKKKFAYPTEPSWSVAQGEHNGRPLILRRNESAALLARHPDYTHRIGIAVPLVNPDENGFPGPEENEELNAIEDFLAEILEKDNDGLQVLTISTSGMREFVFYTRSPKAFASQWETIKSRVQTHQVQASMALDPKWDVFKHFH